MFKQKFFVNNRQVAFLVYAIVFSVFGGGLFILGTGNTIDTSFFGFFDEKDKIVVLSEKGFSPSKIVIEEGDTVIFTTTLGRHFWPASDIHPTHEIYSGFDAKRSLAPKERWSFLFKKAGLWQYHDHLAPSFGGVIIVKSKDNSDVPTLAAQQERICEESPNSLECWQGLLFQALEHDGIAATFQLLDKLYREDSEFALSCHYATHNIGIKAVNLYFNDKESVLTPMASFCANGFYHGFMEGFLGTVNNVKEAAVVCAYFGRELKDEAPDAKLQCFHGIGHGVIESLVAVNRLGEDITLWVKDGLPLCEEASLNSNQLYRCASGLFNSVANFYILGLYGFSPDKEDPLAICHEQLPKYKESCYGNMNALLSWITDHDLAQGLKFVERIPEQYYAVSAAEYLSRTMSFYSKENPEDVIRACRSTQERLTYPCIRGIVYGMLEHGTPGEEYKDALEFCASNEMITDERTVCLKAALSGLEGWYSKEKALTICNSISQEYQQFCKNQE